MTTERDNYEVQATIKESVKNENSAQGCCKAHKDEVAVILNKKRGFFVFSTTVCLCLYLLYIIIACIITFNTVSTGTYYLSRVITHLFIDAPFTGYGEQLTTFRKSSTINDFWAFAEGPMLRGLYRDEWNYDHIQCLKTEIITTSKLPEILDNTLIGRARLRQIRVMQGKCPVKSNKVLCYPRYRRSVEDKKPFFGFPLVNEINKTIPDSDEWKYHSEEQLHGATFLGILDRYSGGGSIKILGMNITSTKSMIDYLKQNIWISRATRVVFLEFTFFNANINVLCTVRLAWEIPATGGVTTSWDIQSIKLGRYSTLYEKFVLLCQVAFISLTVLYIANEVMQLYLAGWKKYFKSIWTYLNIIIFLCSAFCVVYSFHRYYAINHLFDNIEKSKDAFVDIHYLSFWEGLFKDLSSILIFLIWMKLFKYLSFIRSMALLEKTLARSLSGLGGFSIIFLIILLAFSQLGHVLFGNHVFGFSTFGLSFFTLCRFILGDFKYTDARDANRLLGPIFYLAYVVFVFMILVHMFLAIINDSYLRVPEEVNKKGKIIKGRDCLQTVCCRKQGSDQFEPFTDVNEIWIEQHEIRNHLQRKGFSDVEIELFLGRFDVDDNDALDGDESQRLLSNIVENKYVVKHPEVILKSQFKKNPHDNVLSISHKQRIMQQNMVNAEIDLLEKRLEKIDSSLTGLIPKIEAFLKKSTKN